MTLSKSSVRLSNVDVDFRSTVWDSGQWFNSFCISVIKHQRYLHEIFGSTRLFEGSLDPQRFGRWSSNCFRNVGMWVPRFNLLVFIQPQTWPTLSSDVGNQCKYGRCGTGATVEVEVFPNPQTVDGHRSRMACLLDNSQVLLDIILALQ